MSFDANTFFEQFEDGYDYDNVRKFVIGERELTLEDNFDEIREILTNAGTMDGNFTQLEYTLTENNVVYRFNGGDGNDWIVVYKFTNPKDPESHFFLTLRGYYSSWCESKLNTAYVSEPYTFTETRYRKL